MDYIKFVLKNKTPKIGVLGQNGSVSYVACHSCVYNEILNACTNLVKYPNSQRKGARANHISKKNIFKSTQYEILN